MPIGDKLTLRIPSVAGGNVSKKMPSRLTRGRRNKKTLKGLGFYAWQPRYPFLGPEVLRPILSDGLPFSVLHYINMSIVVHLQEV
jgi:hypothetical protein